MGVMATYCQLCALPVHHDHYGPVAAIAGLTLKGVRGIYRGDGNDLIPPAVPFGPEHAWLKEAIGLRLRPEQEPSTITGTVSDGGFDVEDGSVMNGIDERAALHKACYAMIGQPDVWQPEGFMPEAVELFPYQKQLFDFDGLIKNGLGWMLVDPRMETDDARRNRERIRGAMEFYTGNRSAPDFADLLEYFLRHDGTSLELHPLQSPVFRKGSALIQHSFDPLSADRCKEFLLNVIPPQKHDELRASGKLTMRFRLGDSGAATLELVLDKNREFHGVVTRAP